MTQIIAVLYLFLWLKFTFDFMMFTTKRTIDWEMNALLLKIHNTICMHWNSKCFPNSFFKFNCFVHPIIWFCFIFTIWIDNNSRIVCWKKMGHFFCVSEIETKQTWSKYSSKYYVMCHAHCSCYLICSTIIMINARFCKRFDDLVHNWNTKTTHDLDHSTHKYNHMLAVHLYTGCWRCKPKLIKWL